MTSFKERVFKMVRSVPRGETSTYKEVAELAGSPNAYRAVGNIMSNNFDIDILCHRVIKSDGATGGFNRGERNKVELLKREESEL